jgi:hypothetical protein
VTRSIVYKIVWFVGAVVWVTAPPLPSLPVQDTIGLFILLIVAYLSTFWSAKPATNK